VVDVGPAAWDSPVIEGHDIVADQAVEHGSDLPFPCGSPGPGGCRLGLVGERQDDPAQHGMGLTDALLATSGKRS
jgi:hypothetical protein